jgi:drug/metabolite transporter (DMT)-like permease
LIDPASIAGLVAALCMALVDMALRNLGRTENSLTTVFYFLAGGVLLTAPYTLLYGVFLNGETLPWLIGIGIFTAIQQLTKTAAYRFAEASFLVPYTYTSIVWVTLLGWWVWKEALIAPVIAGIAVVILCNVLILRWPLTAGQKWF